MSSPQHPQHSSVPGQPPGHSIDPAMQEPVHVRAWWQKAIILLAGIAVITSLVGSAIFVVVSLRGAFG